ncbi:MAG TPA: hypothetical protein VFV78_08885 [Vicinamibacterales bacterium]|nr:hypothetical protein [Vicinamibacterales bacterium]
MNRLTVGHVDAGQMSVHGHVVVTPGVQVAEFNDKSLYGLAYWWAVQWRLQTCE